MDILDGLTEALPSYPPICPPIGSGENDGIDAACSVELAYHGKEDPIASSVRQTPGYCGTGPFQYSATSNISAHSSQMPSNPPTNTAQHTPIASFRNPTPSRGLVGSEMSAHSPNQITRVVIDLDTTSEEGECSLSPPRNPFAPQNPITEARSNDRRHNRLPSGLMNQIEPSAMEESNVLLVGFQRSRLSNSLPLGEATLSQDNRYMRDLEPGGLDRGGGPPRVEGDPRLIIRHFSDGKINSSQTILEEPGEVQDLVSMAHRFGITPVLDVIDTGDSNYSASLDLGDVKVSVPGPFGSRANAKAAICQQGIYLLKPKLPYGESVTNQSQQAQEPSPCTLVIQDKGVFSMDRVVEAPWRHILEKYASSHGCDIKDEYYRHPELPDWHRYEVMLGRRLMRSTTWYRRKKAAWRGIAKHAMKTLYFEGACPNLPPNAEAIIRESNHTTSEYSLPPLNAVNQRKKKKKQLALARPVTASALTKASQPYSGSTVKATNANYSALGRIRLPPITHDENRGPQPSQGRVPETFDEMVQKINGLCDRIGLRAPVYEINPDCLGSTTYSGAAVFEPNGLMDKTRAGEVLRVHGQERAQELCAHGVLALLEDLDGKNSGDAMDQIEYNDSTLHQSSHVYGIGDKRPAEEELYPDNNRRIKTGLKLVDL